MLYERIAGLEFELMEFELEGLASTTPGGWTRHTTIVRLSGGGHCGVGEDVNWASAEQQSFREHCASLELEGRYTLEEFSRTLDRLNLFATPPSTRTHRLFRRWAFESAALDLALRQNDTNLATLFDRQPAPVNFVVSTGLGKPPTLAALERVRALYPDLGFKVDFDSSWTAATVAALAEFGGVTTIDFKAHYHGSFQGPPANAALYREVAESLEHAWLEDPAWDGVGWDVLEPWRNRVTWDAVIHSLADVEMLPVMPECINIKPSRFGFVAELLRTYEYCEAKGIAMYGGGQFELGPGRDQVQYLASLFHPLAYNDVAPIGFNVESLAIDLPAGPFVPVTAFGRVEGDPG